MVVGNIDRRFRSLVIVSEMCCDDLIRIAADEGITAGPATKSRGCVTITGTAGAAIPSEISLTGGNGVTYVLDNSANPADNRRWTARQLSALKVLSLVLMRILISERLILMKVIRILTLMRRLSTALTAGQMLRIAKALEQRLQEKRRGLNACGTEQWYIDQILSFPGVNRVCLESCECSSCGGCCQSGYLTAYPLFDGFRKRHPSAVACRPASKFYIWRRDGCGRRKRLWELHHFGAQGQFLIA